MRRLGQLLVCAWLIVVTASAQAVQYRIVDLGVGRAWGINNNGQVVGELGTQGKQHAFLWKDGSPIQDLGTFGGFESVANGINDSGQIVGYYSDARDINNNGQVVGTSSLVGNSTQHAFLWQNGSPMQDLGTLENGYSSMAYGINDHGQVAGYSNGQPFLWQSGSPMKSLGDGWAMGINNSGQMVGCSFDFWNHALIWQSGLPTKDLGILGSGNGFSVGNGINNNGQVVGYAYLADNKGERAFLWQPGLPMRDLGTLGRWSEAYAINDNGQIAGTCDDANGIQHAVLWQPSPDPDPCVTITSPIYGPVYWTYYPTIDISGTASATAGIAGIAWTNDRGGSGTCTGATAWSATGISLQPGDNILTVTITSTDGKTSSSELKVTRDIPYPYVWISSPTYDPDYRTEASTIDISGNASDILGLVSVTWANDRGGSGTCDGTDNWNATGIVLQPGDNIITVTATNTSGQTSSFALRVINTKPFTIGAAKKMPQDSPISITDAVVTAVGLESGTAFVESSDRSAGIKIMTDEQLTIGDHVEFTGNTNRADGEYLITEVQFQSITPGTNLKPLFMASTAICNDPTETMNYTGMNTTGLLVAIAGKVTEVECGGIIYIDDGGGFNDQVGNAPGIRVHIPWDVTIPEKGQMVLISGISRIEAQTPGQTMRYVPTIWVRDAGDIKTYNQPQQ